MNKKINKKIGKNIKTIRILSDFSQKYCSEACGIEQATWSQYENGNIELPITRLLQIAEFFGHGINILLRGVI